MVTVGMSPLAHVLCAVRILCAKIMVTVDMSLSAHVLCGLRILCC